jgi:acyl-homoserine-lactone acylase
MPSRYAMTCRNFILVCAYAAAALTAAASVAQPLDAKIRWTAYGVPHVEAEDFESLGYGYGYAVAADRLCLLADRIITLRGERSRWFGADAAAVVGFLPTTNLNSDLFHRVQLSDEEVAAATRTVTADMRSLARGYALGFTRYVNELPPPNRSSVCAGAPIPAMQEADVIRAMMSIGTIWKSFQIAPFAASSLWNGAPAEKSTARATAGATARPPTTIGSNAWAYGGDATRSGAAIVLANPHTFWQDSWLTMHQLHLTIPGKLDVAGADFTGLPLPVVGFNADVAWSIEAPLTVSYFVIQKMKVETDAQPSYVVDGKRRALKIASVAVQVKQADGSIARREFPLAWSEYGALYRLPAEEGRPEGWYAITDAGEGNVRGLDQMLAIAQAKTVAQFRDATAKNRGLGSHLVAGDRHGDALYVEAGPLLDIDPQTLASCRVEGAMFTVLDGSRSECFARDANRRPKVLGEEKQPALLTRGIVQNTNNSYHLSIHGKSVDGYSPLLGEAGQHDWRLEMSEKRMNEVTADGRVTAQEALAVVFDNRNYAAETWLDAILNSCKVPAASERTTRACGILARWDRSNNSSSRGALLFELLWPRLQEIPQLLPPFDAQRPFAVRQMSQTPAALTAIATAVDETMSQLESLALRGDEPWGSMLAVRGRSGKIPLHGGASEAGVLNSLGGGELDHNGYGSITSGSAYLQRVQWEGGAVRADVVLAHGQSADPASPHHTDQLGIFAERRLVRMPFSAAQIAADTVKTLRLRTSKYLRRAAL